MTDIVMEEAPPILSKKGGRLSGEPLRKLNPAIVREMRHLATPEGGSLTQERIADMYGVSQVTVSRVLRRETWKEIS